MSYQILIDTALKNTGLKKELSVKTYSKLSRILKKYLQVGAHLEKQETVELLTQIRDICGPTKTIELLREMEGLRRIIKGLKFE